MLKAAGTMDGLPLLVLGLDGENMTRLMAGEPIIVDAHDNQLRSQFELPALRVLVVGGRNEEDIRRAVREVVM